MSCQNLIVIHVVVGGSGSGSGGTIVGEVHYQRYYKLKGVIMYQTVSNVLGLYNFIGTCK